MRVAILANDRASFILPMAEGLARMVSACGAEPALFYDGLQHLALRQQIDRFSVRSLAGSALRLVPSRRAFEDFLDRLGKPDLIVVVANVPMSFSRGALPNIELLRARLPDVPIVNYDLHYLPVMDSWARHLLRGEQTGLAASDLRIFDRGAFGLERYDWYLMASVGRVIPLPPGPHPCTIIGVDLDDGSLYPAQDGKFLALLDFAQSRWIYPEVRELQLEALRIAGVEYVVLQGSYPIDEIRAIYRRTSAYFLAASESFGLPICELQACGSLVFTPDISWAQGHWLDDDSAYASEPRLSPNFVVYEKNPALLAERILLAATNSNPIDVRGRFLKFQPHFLHGDRAAVAEFLSGVDTGRIHGGLHTSHAHIGR